MSNYVDSDDSGKLSVDEVKHLLESVTMKSSSDTEITELMAQARNYASHCEVDVVDILFDRPIRTVTD